MRFSLLTFAIFASQALALTTPVELLERQTDCSIYDEYYPGPDYTGPCEANNCGAKGIDCRATGWSGCVKGPNFNCPAKFCACTNY